MAPDVLKCGDCGLLSSDEPSVRLRERAGQPLCNDCAIAFGEGRTSAERQRAYAEAARARVPAAPPTVAPARPINLRAEAAKLAHAILDAEPATMEPVDVAYANLVHLLERDRASRSPGPLSGLDAATVEAAGLLATLTREARSHYDDDRCDLFDGGLANAMDEADAFLARRALATPPGQTR